MIITYWTVIGYSIAVFFIRRFIRKLISSRRERKAQKEIDELKIRIKKHPEFKYELKKSILRHKFSNLKGAVKFLMVDIGTFLLFINIGKRIFAGLSFWALIYIVIIVSFALLSTQIKRKWGIEWL